MNTSVGIFLFADIDHSKFGGMESHAIHFIRFFKGNANYKLLYIISKDQKNLNSIFLPHGKLVCASLEVGSIGLFIRKWLNSYRVVCFFNNGWWIEDIETLRSYLPNVFFCQRTGGNEVIKANLNCISLGYKERINYWVNNINNNLNAFITNSAYTTQRVISIGVNKNIIFQISGGVDFRAIHWAQQNRSMLRRAYFSDHHDQICVVSASRFVHFKGLDITLHAISRAQKLKDFIYFIVGGGPEEPFIRTIANRLKGIKCVFLGEKSFDESLYIITSADLLLCLSRECKISVPGGAYIHTETMGRTALEGICAGVPVIATRVGGLPEFVTEDYGYLTEPDSPEEASSKIVMALNARINKKQNLNKIKSNYSWDAIFTQYMTIWDNK